MKNFVLLSSFLALAALPALADQPSLAERASQEVQSLTETAVIVPTTDEAKPARKESASSAPAKTASVMNCHERGDGSLICG